jgi:hypothetical protein
MRTIIIAALIASLAGAAYAQGAGGKRHEPTKRPIETRSIKSRNPRKSPTPGNPCAKLALLA